jgi:methylase of polypeptide subunit release factors
VTATSESPVSEWLSGSLVVDYHGLDIRYDDRVLEPRSWTGAQAEWAAELIRSAPPGPVLELCAGVGHIGLLAVTRTFRRLVAVDVDPVACEYLRLNARCAGLAVDVREGDMREALDDDERFAVVIADPPWVPSADTAGFPEDPRLAIDGGADGLDLVRLCLSTAARHLLPAGSMVLQAGPDQADAVQRLVAAEHPGLRFVEARPFPRGSLVRLDALAG